MPSISLDPSDGLRIIQAADAPVVLISGVGLLLLTLTARLGRIVDQTRLLATERRMLAPRARAPPELEADRIGTAAFEFNQSPSWDPLTPPPDPGFNFEQTLA